MRKKIVLVCMAAVLVVMSLAGCGRKEKLSEETKAQLEAMHIPLSLIPEGVKVTVDDENGIVRFEGRIKTDKIIPVYEKELLALGASSTSVQTKEDMVEAGMLAQEYVDQGFSSWMYDGVLGTGEPIYIFLQDQPIYDSSYVTGLLAVGDDNLFAGTPLPVTSAEDEIQMITPETTTNKETTAEEEETSSTVETSPEGEISTEAETSPVA